MSEAPDQSMRKFGWVQWKRGLEFEVSSYLEVVNLFESGGAYLDSAPFETRILVQISSAFLASAMTYCVIGDPELRGDFAKIFMSHFGSLSKEPRVISTETARGIIETAPTAQNVAANGAKPEELELDGEAEEGEDSSLKEQAADLALLEKLAAAGQLEEGDDFDFDAVENLLELNESQYPRFTLAKNKARFLRMVSWYRQKEEWIEVAPMSGVQKLFKQQTKELEGIRAGKMDYEMELETGTLTPSQRSYRKDELKMCKVHEKMAVHLISKLQIKIKSGRR